LDRAEGSKIKAETACADRKLPPLMKGPIGGIKCLQSAIVKPDPEADMNNGLNKSMKSPHIKASLQSLKGLLHVIVNKNCGCVGCYQAITGNLELTDRLHEGALQFFANHNGNQPASN
jgi:hypothetical protein